MKNHYPFIAWVAGIPALIITLIIIIVCNEPKGEGISRALACKSAVLAKIWTDLIFRKAPAPPGM